MAWMNGTVAKEAGVEKHDADNVISYSRLAHYKGETVRLTMGIWEETEVR